VRLERREQWACLIVIDQGIGIPTEALTQMFQPFYRAPNTIASAISGMGIGLFVVKEIVALHSGEVDVVSTEGQGSTFIVRLPLLAEG
jgi:signal transduction histidine kinase